MTMVSLLKDVSIIFIISDLLQRILYFLIYYYHLQLKNYFYLLVFCISHPLTLLISFFLNSDSSQFKPNLKQRRFNLDGEK